MLAKTLPKKCQSQSENISSGTPKIIMIVIINRPKACERRGREREREGEREREAKKAKRPETALCLSLSNSQ